MTTYGATTIPIAAPADPTISATGDPALDVWAAYLKAYINAYGATAWAKVFPRSLQSGPIPPVLMTFTHQPLDETIAPFNESYLPALFVYRSSGAEQKWEMLEWRVARDTVTLLWVLPTGTQAADRIRVPFVNALVKLVDAAIEAMQDPSYVHPGDTDSKAATIAADPDAIKLSIATNAAPQTYTGAALDGATGNASFLQPRAFTVKLAGDGAAFVNGSKVAVTGLDVLGRSMTREITISGATIPATFASDYAFTKITSIAVEAQASGAGSFEFGLAAYQGTGSMVLNFSPIGLKRAGTWKAQPITVPVTTTGAMTATNRYYDAVEIPLEMMEVWERDGQPTLAGINGVVSANEGAYEQTMTVPI